MKYLLQIGLVVMVSLSSPGLADDAADGPRTGYFRKSVTPLELLGEQGARAISGVFAPDQKLTWQLSVPKTYNAAKPAGAIVFVGKNVKPDRDLGRQGHCRGDRGNGEQV